MFVFGCLFFIVCLILHGQIHTIHSFVEKIRLSRAGGAEPLSKSSLEKDQNIKNKYSRNFSCLKQQKFKLMIDEPIYCDMKKWVGTCISLSRFQQKMRGHMPIVTTQL